MQNLARTRERERAREREGEIVGVKKALHQNMRACSFPFRVPVFQVFATDEHDEASPDRSETTCRACNLTT